MSARLASLTRASLVLAAALVSAPAFAQAPAPAAAGTATPAPAPAAHKRNAVVEQRISQLHSSLKITPAEQPQFDVFANVMRDDADQMDNMVTKRLAAAKSGTAVDQMQAYSDMAAAHAQQMQRLLPAFTALYDTLTPAQKKLADNSFRQFADRAQARAATRS